MTAYDKLPFLPSIIAETVCEQPYTGQELSEHGRSADAVQKTESARQAMTPEQVAEFSKAADDLCRAAYKVKANWFMDCVKAKGNKGRDQLYVWAAHWLSAYLAHPKMYIERLYLNIKAQAA